MNGTGGWFQGEGKRYGIKPLDGCNPDNFNRMIDF